MITSSPAWAAEVIATEVAMPENELPAYTSVASKASQNLGNHSLNPLQHCSAPLTRVFTQCRFCPPLRVAIFVQQRHIIQLPLGQQCLPSTFNFKGLIPRPPVVALRPMALFSQPVTRAHAPLTSQVTKHTSHGSAPTSTPLGARFHTESRHHQAAVCHQVMLRSHQNLTLATPWLHQERQQQDRQEDPEQQFEEVEISATQKSQHTFNYTPPAMDAPVLEPPRIGVFALYYILTKVGIVSDALSHWEAKQNIQTNQEEMDALHKARLDELKKALVQEEETNRWSVSVKVFSWLTAFMSVIAGLVMIVTGVGAVAGALLVAGGVFTLTNQVLEVTGGWQKIAGLLPGDSPEKKRAIIMWMQLGISVLCLILAAAGIFFGGYASVGEAMNQFMAVFGGVVMIGQGVSSIGQGVTLYLHKEGIAESRIYARRLVDLKHRREDLMDKVEASIARMKQLFEDMAHALDFAAELFRSDQMVLGR